MHYQGLANPLEPAFSYLRTIVTMQTADLLKDLRAAVITTRP